MSHIAVFHSVLGVRLGVIDAADKLTAAGHHVTVVDQYGGKIFDDYEPASSYADSVGYPTLMEAAGAAVADLPDGFIALGFSNGAGMAEYVATQRKVGSVVLVAGALALDMLGVDTWPRGVPAQIHYSVDDPFRDQAGIDSLIEEIRRSGSAVEFFEYPGGGHLFTDASLPDEYNEGSASLMWNRVIDFCEAPTNAPSQPGLSDN